MKKKINRIIAGKGNGILFTKIILAVVLLFFQLITSAQQRTISGKVTGTDNQPIPGVTVQVKGTALGSLTGIDGTFTLPNVPNSAEVLSFSFIGYKTVEVKLGPQKFFSIILEEEVVGLEEVIVIGYGVQKKESVVGAITQVGTSSLVQSGLTNVTNAMTGKLSGVLTLQESGQPGNNQADILVRGLSSWNSSSPLVLVDGVERDFKDIDPNEINTISVLKDASATAVFGARGGNGVVIVSTKRGSLGKARFSASASTGIQVPTHIPEHISSYTTMSMLNVARMNMQQFDLLTSRQVLEEYRNPSTPLNALRYPNVNWFKEITKPFAPTSQANLNIQGGTNFVKYFFSLGYLYEGTFFKCYNDGILDSRFKYNKYNYRANVDFNLTKSTQFSLNIGGDIGDKNEPPNTLVVANSGIWQATYGASPARFPAYWPSWVLEQIPDPDYPNDSGVRLVDPSVDIRGNPYNIINQGSYTKNVSSTLFTDIILDQKLDYILEGLSAKGKVSFSTYYVNLAESASISRRLYSINWDKVGTDQNPWYTTGQGLELYKQVPVSVSVGAMQGGYYKDLYYEMSLNYSNSFGKHRVTGLALLNRQQKNAATEFPYYNEGLVGRATYDYSNKYLMEVNVGYTGSERFAPGNRFGFFPSGALGWVVSEEDFFKDAVPWMNRLKLRYSDGLVGSDYAANRWLYISDYKIDSRGNIIEDPSPNRNAQWEEAHKRDVGIELGFFNSFDLTVDLFDEQRSNMLVTPQNVTPMVGNTYKELNLGKVKKHGIDLEAEYHKTVSGNFNYFIKGIFGFNENRVIYKDSPKYAPDYMKAEGKSLNYQDNGIKLTGSGYYTSVDDIHRNPSPIGISQLFAGEFKFLDYNTDGQITVLDKIPLKGNVYPPITYSLSGGFKYKNFEFNCLFTGVFGKYIEFNSYYQWEFDYGSYRVHKSQLDYWRPDNPNASHSSLHYVGDTPPILSWVGGFLSSKLNIAMDNGRDGEFWKNSDFLRLRDVYAGYNFNTNFLKRAVGVSSMLLYAKANNVFTITKLIEGDPERRNFIIGFYPIVALYNIGAKFNF